MGSPTSAEQEPLVQQPQQQEGEFADTLWWWEHEGVLPAFLVNLVGGLIFGVSLGLLPVLLQFNTYLSDCSRYTSYDSCSQLFNFSGCRWVPTTHTTDATNTSFACLFQDHTTVNCSSYTDLTRCQIAPDCDWRYHQKTCKHSVGWSPSQQGMLAGLQIVGGLAMSLVASHIIMHPVVGGTKKALLWCGICATVSCVLFSVGWQDNANYVMLALSMVCVGLSSGLAFVVCPNYAADVLSSNPKMQHRVSVILERAIAFALCISSVVGLIIDPKNDTALASSSSSVGNSLVSRLQICIGLQWLTAVSFFPLSFYIPESPVFLAHKLHHHDEPQQRQQQQEELDDEKKKKNDDDDDDDSDDDSDDDNDGDFCNRRRGDEERDISRKDVNHDGLIVGGDDNNPSSSTPVTSDEDINRITTPTTPPARNKNKKNKNRPRKKKKALSLPQLICSGKYWTEISVGVALAVGFQLTGIGAISVYVPHISEQLGIAPLLGNFGLQTWCFITAFLPMILVRHFSGRRLFIGGLVIAALACITTAIALFPGTLEPNSSAQRGVAVTGILMFILQFESCTGPLFFLLASTTFPERARSAGISFCMLLNWVLNGLVNWGFPVVQVALSGGLSGDQHRGLAYCFGIFSVCAVLSGVFLAVKTKEEDDKQKDQDADDLRGSVYYAESQYTF